jgi:hypothetical protein
MTLLYLFIYLLFLILLNLMFRPLLAGYLVSNTLSAAEGDVGRVRSPTMSAPAAGARCLRFNYYKYGHGATINLIIRDSGRLDGGLLWTIVNLILTSVNLKLQISPLQLITCTAIT